MADPLPIPRLAPVTNAIFRAMTAPFHRGASHGWCVPNVTEFAAFSLDGRQRRAEARELIVGLCLPKIPSALLVRNRWRRERAVCRCGEQVTFFVPAPPLRVARGVRKAQMEFWRGTP